MAASETGKAKKEGVKNLSTNISTNTGLPTKGREGGAGGHV